MKKPAALLTLLLALCVQLGFAQSRTITGIVKSSESGETLPGVAILEKGTRNGTSTDFDGKFTIILSGTSNVLVFQAIGMAPKEVEVGTETFISVQMETADEQLDEVVVTALGAEREKRSLGYSTSVVDGDELTKSGDRSAITSLQGKVAGVNITNSGTPGASTRVIIRGAQSATQGNQPLYVVDGVPIYNAAANATQLEGSYDFGNGANNINPEDIENVSVLKGASATALYGSRAANGVILITTKKGGAASGKKAFGISYAGNVTFSSPIHLPTLQNTYGQGWDGTHILDENGSWGPLYDGRDRVWGRVVDNSQLLKPYVAQEDNLSDFFERGVSFQNSVSFNTGDENSSYYASFSNINSDGVFPTDVDSYKRNTIALRGSERKGIFSISGSFNLSDVNGSSVPSGQGPTVYNNIMQIPRDLSIVDMQNYNSQFYNIDNYFTSYGVINPYYTLNEFGSKYEGSKIFGGLEAGVDLTTWATLNYRFGYDYTTDMYNVWEAIIAPTPGSPNAGSSIEDGGSVRQRSVNRRQLNHDIMLNLRHDFSPDLKLTGLIGLNINERQYTDVDAYVSDLDIPGFYDLSNSATPIGPAPGKTNVEDEMLRRYMGLYAQGSFDYKNYLFLDLTVRNDWSSTLPIDNNSYFYYGANLSWVFTDQLEIKSKIFNYGKLRIGYGTTGNDADPYVVLPTFISTSVQQPFRDYNAPVGGTNFFEVSNRLGSPDLQPEITSEFEIGGEFRFFTGRVTLDLTYYNRVTTDLILDVPTASESGYDVVTQNVGEIENKGIEALIDIAILRNDDFKGLKWNLQANFSNNKNNVNKLNNDLKKVELGGLSTTGYVMVEGQPMGVFESTVPKYQPGTNNMVVDANGVPVSASTKQFIGNSQYDYILGITNRFQYKGVSLEFTFDIRQGGKMFSRTADITNFTGNGVKTMYNDRRPFIVPGSVQEIPNGDGTFSYTENTTIIDQEHIDDYHRADALDPMYVIDKSFVKLREIVLAYQLPKSTLEKSPFSAVSFSIFARNLFVWTPVDNQFVDPEVTTFGNDIQADFGEFSANPSVRTYGVGLKASF